MEIAYSEVLQGVRNVVTPRRSICPPNRLETRNRDLLAALPKLRDSGTLLDLADFLRRLTGRAHIVFVPSCRAAIFRILSLLPQKEVVMPVFTCPVVGAAVKAAGKEIIYVDSARHNINSTSVEFSVHAKPNRILLPTHLFGIPTDITNISEVARAQGCVTIEDAAAACGAEYNGRPLGTSADFGVFSFERSKRFPAFRGAAIVVNNNGILDPRMLSDEHWKSEHGGALYWDLAFAMAHNIATIPWIYGRFVLPKLLRRYAAWGRTGAVCSAEDPCRSPYYVHRFHPFQAALVLRMLGRLEQIRAHIRLLVSTYVEVLRDAPLITFVPDRYDAAGMLRFPIALEVDRTRFLRLALERGIFLETNYEALLAESATQGGFPNATWVSRNMVLLPLYTGLSMRNARGLARVVAAIAGQA